MSQFSQIAVECPLVECAPSLCGQPQCPAQRGVAVTRTPVRAVKLIRALRGQSQPWLARASDGKYYVIKWADAFGVRGAIAEVFQSLLSTMLGVRVPPMAVLAVGSDITADRERKVNDGSLRLRSISAGLHYGSRVIPDYEKTAIYDVLPEVLYGKLANGSDFSRTLVVDKWLNNQDARQAVFYRPGPKAFVADMIDHGHSLGGPSWQIRDSPLYGLHRYWCAYDDVHGWDDLRPIIDAISSLDCEVLQRLLPQVPAEWLDSEVKRPDLIRMAEELWRRRVKVQSLIQDVLDCQSTQIFRNWGALSSHNVTRKGPDRSTSTGGVPRAMEGSLPIVQQDSPLPARPRNCKGVTAKP